MSAEQGTSYFNDIYGALQAKDPERARTRMRTAFDDKSLTEPELAQLCDLAFHTKAEKLYDFLGEFAQRFPGSLFGAKALLATLLVERGRVDDASELAREHLRALRDRGVLAALVKGDGALGGATELLTDGASRGFLVVTAAYLVAGARSYALRALDVARASCKSLPSAVHALDRQIARIRGELADASNAAADQAWEKFFETGEGLETLAALCRDRQLEKLARRVELLAEPQPFDAELFLLVRRMKPKGAAPVTDDAEIIEVLT